MIPVLSMQDFSRLNVPGSGWDKKMENYCKEKNVDTLPRLPLQGHLDLTYRCNNNCRHCWLWLTPAAVEKKNELSFADIERIAGEARSMGCCEWIISGGEPMLRDDFVEIFDLLTRRSRTYTLNSNGALITPKIARLLKRRGVKLIALYGADAQVHDFVTRNPGSFAATRRGIAYLQEAGAEFMVQIVPMRANFHQFQEMIRLALKLSPHWRVGASWLYLSANGDLEKNEEIRAQRLLPNEVMGIDPPDMAWVEDNSVSGCGHGEVGRTGSEWLFSSCLKDRRDFHVDPYGNVSFCQLIKDPRFRLNLRNDHFSDYWEKFMPALADKVRADIEYRKNCGSCSLRNDCNWCPAYAFLEKRSFSAKIDYLCSLAVRAGEYKKKWIKNHRRYYQLAGMTIQVDADRPITNATFDARFEKFKVPQPGDDVVRIRHHFFLPDLRNEKLGRKIYQKTPWTIFQKGGSWIYLEAPNVPEGARPEKISVVNRDHSSARIYHYDDFSFQKGNFNALTLFPTDQILLARTLAERQAFFLHSCGIKFAGQGFLFAGHSEAGKSTIGKMFKDHGEILCDDRMVVRKWPQGYFIHGTWSHGELPDVSPDAAPLRAIFFLEKAQGIQIVELADKKIAVERLLAVLIKPLTTSDWWAKIFNLIEDLVQEIPCYILRFELGSPVVDTIGGLFRQTQNG